MTARARGRRGGEAGGVPVQPDGRRGGLDERAVRIRGDHGGDDPGQHVPRPGRREPPGPRLHGDERAVGCREDGARALAQHHAVDRGGHVADVREIVRGPVDADALAQPRELPAVRRGDERGAGGRRQIERSGVDDHGDVAVDDLPQRLRLRRAPVVRIGPGPDHPGADPRASGIRPADGLRASCQHRRHRRRRAHVADESGTGAPGGLDAQHRGAGVGGRSGADAHDAPRVLVVLGGRRAEEPRRVAAGPLAHVAHDSTLARRPCPVRVGGTVER
ncbi:unnamed protein product, partial [Penicillium discolor]